MCIFRFNPPAPGPPCKRCLRCVCVPRYWLLEYSGGVPGLAASSTILQFEYHPEFPLDAENANYCYWGNPPDYLQGTSDPRIERPRPENDFFEAHNFWRLGTYIILDFDPGGAIEFQEWTLWGGGPGNVAYTRTRDPSGHYHFDCLGPNTFYYNAANDDPGGEEDPILLGWPSSLTITPYYP